ncbi:MAG: DNA polymerase III subunit chi [Gammaproteobacteria bacterium]
MTRISFYTLSQDGAQIRFRTACKLVEKAHTQGLTIYIHTAGAADSTVLDDLLWTFKDGSFIPHAVHPRPAGDHSPIVIGHDHEPTGEHNLLINLSNELPAFFSRFERVAEIVDGQSERLARGRERFKFYKDRGYPLEHHKL